MHDTRGGMATGTLFVLPGAVCIMALSYRHAGWGKVSAVVALFFDLEAAVLAVVLQAMVRVGPRALKNRAMLGIAAAFFIAIFFLAVPFPVIVLATGLIGWLGTRASSTLFQIGGGHGEAAAQALTDADSLLGEELPDHARATVATARRAASVRLPLWLAPVLLLAGTLGTGATFSRRRHRKRDGSGNLRRRVCSAGLRRSAIGPRLPLAASRRDGERIGMDRLPGPWRSVFAIHCSRTEILPERHALLRMGRALVDLYCQRFRQAPRRIVLDIDDTFDTVHGGQQPRLFNATTTNTASSSSWSSMAEAEVSPLSCAPLAGRAGDRSYSGCVA